MLTTMLARGLRTGEDFVVQGRQRVRLISRRRIMLMMVRTITVETLRTMTMKMMMREGNKKRKRDTGPDGPRCSRQLCIVLLGYS